MRAQRSRALVLAVAVVGLPFVLLEGFAGLSMAVVYAMPCGCEPDARLQMTRVAERIEIHSLRKKLPSNDEGLAVVFGAELPKDSWGNDFVYVTPGPDGKPFDLISLGADGQEGGQGNDVDIKYSAVH